jgi:hypothetical protein
MCVKCGDLQMKKCSSGYRGALVREAFSHCAQASEIFDVTASTLGPVFLSSKQVNVNFNEDPVAQYLKIDTSELFFDIILTSYIKPGQA